MQQARVQSSTEALTMQVMMETEMMAPRWKNYEFSHQFSPQEEKNLPSAQDALQN